MGVVCDEGLSNAQCSESGNNLWDVPVCTSVVVPKKAHCVQDAKVVVEEACKKGKCSVGA